MKKALKTASAVLIIFWGVVTVSSLIARSVEDGLDAIVYNLFLILGALGIVSSALLFAGFSVPRAFKSCALWATAAANAVLYLFLVLIFTVGRDYLLLLPILWVVFAVAGIVLSAVSMSDHKSSRGCRASSGGVER